MSKQIDLKALLESKMGKKNKKYSFAKGIMESSQQHGEKLFR